MLSVALGLFCALVGAAVAWAVLRGQPAALRQRAEDLEQQLAAAQEDTQRRSLAENELRGAVARLEAKLEHERKAADEKLDLLAKAKQELSDAFASLSAQALKTNNESFLQLAKTNLERFQTEAKGDLDMRQKAVEELVSPIRESLTSFDKQVRDMEVARGEAYGALFQQVTSLISTQKDLRSETENLVRALRSPVVRGRWGEIQLRRVVEIAGMLPHCDFDEQLTINGNEGRLRPDLIVRLPGGKNVIVDAKTPLQAYLEAVEATDEDLRRAKLIEHARQIRVHVEKLSSKQYWDQFESTPDLVVMFLPGETFFSAALGEDPCLLEDAVNKRVILASPITLVAILKGIAYGWQQEKIAMNSQRISDLGKEIYDRLRVLAGHFEAVGKGLDRAVESYNKAVGSLETRVLVTARKFPELGAAVSSDIPEIEPVETTARNLQIDWDEEPGEETVKSLATSSQAD